ncbi:hypothetical protein Tco_0611834, partial [Tanacetum coccineum]
MIDNDRWIMIEKGSWMIDRVNFDEFDKKTGSSDGLQPKQADLSCVHALNEPSFTAISLSPRVLQHISTDEEVDEPTLRNMSFGDRMAYKSYVIGKRQRRETRTKFEVLKNFMKRIKKQRDERRAYGGKISTPPKHREEPSHASTNYKAKIKDASPHINDALHLCMFSPHTPNPPLDKKDLSLEETLDDLFRIGAKSLRRMEQEVQHGCDEEKVGDIKQENGDILNFPIFPVTNVFASVCEHAEENINVNTTM